MATDLLTATDKDFTRVWEVMKAISETERHFNGLETKYRILASQWLLASFAGMGFIITSKTDLPFDALWVIIGICFVSSVGIFQLWRMDLIVYHQLLHAAFSEGVEMEKKFSFLPQIKSAMLHSQKGKDVTRSIVYYYSGSISVLLIVAAITFFILKLKTLSTVQVALVPVLAVGSIMFINFYMRSKSVEKSRAPLWKKRTKVA